jgi:branched-chain amino acid aminotransferase
MTREVRMGEAGAEGGTRPPWPGGAAWIDGRYCPIEDARISVLDLGASHEDPRYSTPVRYDEPG